MGRVSVVLVTWNSAKYLPRCLEGLRLQDPRIEIIAVDNASEDGSAELAAQAGAYVIRNTVNEGFAKAANQGIRRSQSEFVLLCNPDAYLMPDYAARLVAALDAAGEEFGAATGKLLRARGEAIEPAEGVDSMGIRMTRSGRHLDIDQFGGWIRDIGSGGAAGGRQPGSGNPAYEVFGVSGAAALYRRSFLDDTAVGGEYFDEDFFAYREDADLAWRGRIFGWRALFVPGAIGYHVRRVTPARRRELPRSINMHSVKNRFLLRLKNEGRWLALRNAPFELARDLVVLASVLTVERTSLPALGWLWKNRRRVMEKRREIQRRRRVADRAIAAWFH